MTTDFNPETAEVQSAVPDLEIKNEIARGGQKVVFLAQSAVYGPVALKIIRPGSGQAQERAERELSIARSLTDPRFPRIFESRKILLAEEAVLCVCEEFVQGNNLRQHLRAVGSLGVKETLQLAREVLIALQQLHIRNTVHRDVKPENIYLAHDGRVLLLDLGIARDLGDTSLTADHAMFGPLTPGYGAPEQIKNEKRKITSRTDIFALGVVIHECLTGQNPFAPPGTSPAQALQNTLLLRPHQLPAHVPIELDKVVSVCLEKSTHRRFSSPSAMLREIEVLLERTP